MAFPIGADEPIIQQEADGISQVLTAAGDTVAIPVNSAGELPEALYIASTAGCRFRLVHDIGDTTSFTLAYGSQKSSPIVVNSKGFSHIRLYRHTGASVAYVTPLENASRG